MFPSSSLNNLFYPMSADIYYATQSQNDFGEIIKDWNKDRTIKCSAIKQNPDSKVPKFLSPEQIIEYDLSVNFRTGEDILQSSDDQIYRITDILIKDIKDSKGNFVWRESLTDSTVFEVRAVEPMFDMFSVLMGYRVYLVRADDQEL